MRILAVDPSLRGTGFAILEEKGSSSVRCLEYSVVKNAPSLSQEACLVAIHEAISSAIKRHSPAAMAIEKVIYVQSYPTAIILGAARGVAVLAAAQHGLTVYEYPPKRVKQAVVGKGAAAKEQVSFMIRALLGLTETPPADAADAIAIGLTHLRNAASPVKRVTATRGQMKTVITPRWLGRISYAEGLDLQESLVSGKIGGDQADHLLLLEHDPVYTTGRTRDESSLREETLLPHPVHRTNRGGQATYHGPGQLVGYPVLDLVLFDRDLHSYLRFLEEVLIMLLALHGIPGGRIDGKTGVWVGGRKIASLGVGVRKWISMHGFAINVCGDLSPFNHITPCGLPGVEMTSLEAEGARGVTVESCAHEVAEIFDEFLQSGTEKGRIWNSGNQEKIPN